MRALTIAIPVFAFACYLHADFPGDGSATHKGSDYVHESINQVLIQDAKVAKEKEVAKAKAEAAPGPLANAAEGETVQMEKMTVHAPRPRILNPDNAPKIFSPLYGGAAMTSNHKYFDANVGAWGSANGKGVDLFRLNW